ncbi:glycosyltransferase [Buchananella felis]|uniref:glycosyltransferase n=1 Tax=Buchananella felis TaxID=3231492 RepID=UPI0035286B1A
MHVLWLPSWFSAFAGDMAGSFFTEQAAALAGAGLEVGVLAPQPVNFALPRRTPVRLSQEGGVAVARFAAPQVIATTRRLSTLWAAPALHAAYAAYVRTHGVPDVLHAHSLYPGAFFAAHLSRREGIPFVYTEHRSLTHMPVRTWAGRASERAVVAAATHRTAVSRGQADHLTQRFGPQSGAWLYTPNLLPLGQPEVDQAAPAPASASAPAARGPVLGHLSLLGEEKRTDLIVAAFEELHAHWRACGAPAHSRPLLRIAGPTDGPDGQRTRAQVAASPAREQIELTGQLERAQIPAFCAGLDLFLLPSDTETFGVAAIEALAQGTPVIATRTWGGRSVVQEGDGHLVPIGDAPALAAAIRAQLAGPRPAGANTAGPGPRAAGDCAFTPEPAGVRAERARRCVERFGAQAWIARWREIYQQAATSSR